MFFFLRISDFLYNFARFLNINEQKYIMRKVLLLIICVLGSMVAFGSSVPDQCEDVMMQGFYWNSYHVDTADYATTIYGDTRWKTLYKQSSEIGAYFDLIWLPPSAYASGVGYHPKQYSNQNSDWGTRAELEALIAAFHNEGTRVVADMVVNHIEAAAGWCDFMRQNFGEYGIFEPDASWICKTDEMNADDPDIKKEANDCWGARDRWLTKRLRVTGHMTKRMFARCSVHMRNG